MDKGLIEETDNFKKLVNLVDKLRDVGLNDHISMPRIAVLGSQSSGKSSLLEAIVGLNFLPRGSGVVTRRPLELRLIRTNKLPEGKPYGVFKDEEGKMYYDFNVIRERIEGLTEELCGDKKNIVDNPIVLKVFSDNCPDLTVIDLPGITRIPIGDQPKDIERITKEMVKRYCRDERTIILCVIPANADMSTSEALQMAQDLDPEGTRTIGVITKIDIMDKGTDARKMILNQEIPLKMGYIGVKGRTQEDIQNKMSVGASLREEDEFFSSHPAYRHLPREVLGTRALVGKLTSVMYKHMKNVLPSILKEINHKIKNCESNLSKLGDPIPEDNKEKLDAIWRDISVFYDKFKSNIKGEFIESYSKVEMQKMKILASAQIYILFNNLFKPFMNKYRASMVYTDREMNKIISMYSGNTLPGFVSMDCYVALISPLLEKLRIPALEILEKVFQILRSVGSTIINETFNKMISVKNVLIHLFNDILKECKENCEKYINFYMDCQSKTIYTKDPSYIINAHTWPEEVTAKANPNKTPNPDAYNTVNSVNQPGMQQSNINQATPNRPNPQGNLLAPNQMNGQNVTNKPQSAETEPQKVEGQEPEKHKMNKKERKDFLIKEMRKRIDHYFEINVRQVGDMIPKIITNSLINEVLEKIYFSMFRKVSDSNILNSIKEPDHISQQRKNLNSTLEILNNSKKILLKDPELKVGVGMDDDLE